MQAGSTDSILTLLASMLVAVLLFIGQSVIENRGDGWLPQRRGETSVQVDSDAVAGGSETSSIDWGQSSPEEFTAQPGFPSETMTAGLPPEPAGSSASASASTFKVIGIVDGDTVDVLVNNSPLRLRLNGIDTPEKGQPFGDKAKSELSKLIGGKFVQYIVRDTDRYNRSIADIYIGDQYVNLWLVQQGLAWHYVAYSDDPQLSAAEEAAKAAKRGLFSDPRRVAPWNWRRLSKLERDEFR